MGKRKTKFRFYLLWVVILTAISTLSLPAFGQQMAVSGTVTDQAGVPLPGVTVVVKGTTQGTVTNADGEYSIPNISEDATLQFSFVGMSTQEVEVSNQTTIDVTMVADAIGLEEVVAVGYGTQRKANLTGSVAIVGSDDLMKRPVSNVENLLQGRSAGVQITQAYGKPGDAFNEIRIRGVGTFSGAGSAPLVLIDGVAGDLTSLNPNDVESVTILKDAASAAIYGARAANGVILVTTKRGKEQPITVEYHGTIQAHRGIGLPDLVTNSADYMDLWNQANERAGVLPYFTQEEIQAFRDNPDHPNYPNYDWVGSEFRTAFNYHNHIGISGGTEQTNFNLGVGYIDEDAVVGIWGAQSYNLNLSVDSKVNDWFTVGGNIKGAKRDITKSVWDSEAFDWRGEYLIGVYGSGPNYTPTMTLPDGTTGYVVRYSPQVATWTARNPRAMDAGGSFKENINDLSAQLHANIKLGNNLNWFTKGAFSRDDYFGKRHGHNVDQYYFTTGELAHSSAAGVGVFDNITNNDFTTFFSTLKYQQVFNDNHNVNVLVGYNQEYNSWKRLYGWKPNFPTTTLSELAAGDSEGQRTTGDATEWALQSYFSRVTYNFRSKYLLEFNARYDGTSRIHPDNRWGFFPSASAGWRISSESFMAGYTWMDNLMLRTSWGKLGNQNIGLYPYQETLALTSYPTNSSINPGVLMTRMVDPSLRWETTTMLDFGFDLTLGKGLFTATVDWYEKVTDDILQSVAIPGNIGLSAPTVNFGKMSNIGWDIELGHRNQIGEFRYDVSVNYSTYKNEVLRVPRTTYPRGRIIEEGHPINSHYLVEMAGIFQTQSEIDAAPEHPFNPKPGDLRFVDANDDGVINADDRVIIDGAHPDFLYGGNINLAWKNFNLSAFFQGVYGIKHHVRGWGNVPFLQGGAPSKHFVENMWTPDNPSNEYPHIHTSGYGAVMGTRSTYWLWDASYLRLKNLSIGYNIPRRLLQKTGLEEVNVYISGDNLFTITDYPEGDPERVNIMYERFNVYPQIGIYTLGVNVKF